MINTCLSGEGKGSWWPRLLRELWGRQGRPLGGGGSGIGQQLLDAGIGPVVVGVVIAGQVHVVHHDVDLGDLEGRHPLHRADHVAPDGLAELADLDAVLDREVQIDGGLTLADLDGYALAQVGPGRGSSPAGAEGAGRPTAEW